MNEGNETEHMIIVRICSICYNKSSHDSKTYCSDLSGK
jgi:hypothetical protein